MLRGLERRRLSAVKNHAPRYSTRHAWASALHTRALNLSSIFSQLCHYVWNIIIHILCSLLFNSIIEINWTSNLISINNKLNFDFKFQKNVHSARKIKKNFKIFALTRFSILEELIWNVLHQLSTVEISTFPVPAFGQDPQNPEVSFLSSISCKCKFPFKLFMTLIARIKIGNKI